MVVLDPSMEKNVPKKLKNDKKSVFLNRQDLKLAKCLAGNNKSVRDKALKSLHKWFSERSRTLPFNENDFKTIWKGLFYSMWMSDKPLVQEECAECISKLIHFPTMDTSLLFFKVGLQTLQNEWFGIDQLRLDKFLMLVRRFLRQALIVLKKHGFNKKDIENFNKVLEETTLNTEKNVPGSLFMHFTEIFLEELAKVSQGNLRAQLVTIFLKPFIRKLALTTDMREVKCISNFILKQLIRQHDLGLEYQEKYNVWRQQGFPGSINSVQKVLLDNDDDDDVHDEADDDNVLGSDSEHKPLDPRAGRVNVELSQIKFLPKTVAEALLEYKHNPKTTTHSRAVLTALSEMFKKLANGIYPLGVTRIRFKKRNNLEDDDDIDIRKAAKRLIKFENKIMGKNKNRKRKLSLDKNENEDGQVKKKKIDIKEEVEDKDNLVELIHKKKRKNSEGGNHLEISKSITKKTIADVKQSVTKKLQKRNIKQKKSHKVRAHELLKGKTEVEFVFKRNSGVWFVTKNEANERASQNALSPGKINDMERGSPKPGDQPVKLFETPNNDYKFPESAWDEPLQEGEYEICIPSRKYINKYNTNVKKVKNVVHKNYGMIKRSDTLKPNGTSTPVSALTESRKKVRINVRLNKSQEIHEHISQVMLSPQIPYDSSKKPGKPLLKTPVRMTPVNPFYKLL